MLAKVVLVGVAIGVWHDWSARDNAETCLHASYGGHEPLDKTRVYLIESKSPVDVDTYKVRDYLATGNYATPADTTWTVEQNGIRFHTENGRLLQALQSGYELVGPQEKVRALEKCGYEVSYGWIRLPGIWGPTHLVDYSVFAILGCLPLMLVVAIGWFLREIRGGDDSTQTAPG